MLAANNCEKMIVLSSTASGWQQSHIDEKGYMASTGRVTEKEKPSQDKQQQPLKCPRCDSSNTKFCYYNNYSLSQPRHFCKACKRYWTRGGTLRNVPVGGGCRKNKRFKRPVNTANEPPNLSSSASTAPPNLSVQSRVNYNISSSFPNLSPLFYGLPTNPLDLSFPCPRLNSTATSTNVVSGSDLQSHPGLGFSSGLLGSEIKNDNYNRNVFDSSSSKGIQDVVTSDPLLSSNPSLGYSSSTSTLASLIASSLQRQKLESSGFKNMQGPNSFQGLKPSFESLEMAGNVEGGTMKEQKIEGGQNRLDWDVHNQNRFEQINNNSDPCLWNIVSASAWVDPSVASLI